MFREFTNSVPTDDSDTPNQDTAEPTVSRRLKSLAIALLGRLHQADRRTRKRKLEQFLQFCIIIRLTPQKPIAIVLDMTRTRKIGITPTRRVVAKKRPGPKPLPCGRKCVSVHMPCDLIPFVDSLPGKSRSDKIVGCLTVMASAKPTPISKGL